MKKIRITIDKDKLDEELVRQPLVLKRSGDRLADAKAMVEELKRVLELKEASLSRRVRANPTTHGLKSSTESAIKEFVACNEEIQALRKRHIQLKHTVDLCVSLVSATSQRKTLLENLVRLFLADYFAAPALSSEMNEVVGKRGEKTAANKVKRHLAKALLEEEED